MDLNDCVNDVQVNSLQYCTDQVEIHATVSNSFIRVDMPLVRSSYNSVGARTCTGSGDPPSAIPFCYTGSKLGVRVNLKVNSFDSDADSFDLTGSGLEDIQVSNACWKLFCLEHDIQPLILLRVHGEAWRGDVARCHRSRHGVQYSDGGDERTWSRFREEVVFYRWRILTVEIVHKVNWTQRRRENDVRIRRKRTSNFPCYKSIVQRST